MAARSKYSEEVQIKAIARVLAGVNLGEVASSYGIAASALSRWVREVNNDVDESLPVPVKVAWMKRKVAILQAERDFLIEDAKRKSMLGKLLFEV